MKAQIKKWLQKPVDLTAPQKPSPVEVENALPQQELKEISEVLFESGFPTEDSLALEKTRAENQALFLKVAELYRVIELFDRHKEFLISVFSEHRTREHFEKALQTRYFHQSVEELGGCPLTVATLLTAGYNQIHELSFSLKHTSKQPTALRLEVTSAAAKLRRCWNLLADQYEKHYSCSLTRLED